MWYILFILSLIIYIVLANIILPMKFLKISYAGLKPANNIVKTIDEKYTQAIVYEYEDPRYIEKYALIQKNGYKEVVLKLNPSVKSIKYDIVLFDKKANVTKIIRLQEKIKDGIYTHNTKVNDETSSVMIVVNKVNDTVIKNRFKKVYLRHDMNMYIIITSILYLVILFFLTICLINLFGDVFYQDIVKTGLLIPYIAFGLVLYFVLTFFTLRHRKL